MRDYVRQITSYVREDPKTYALFVAMSIVVGLLEFGGITSLVPVVSVMLGEGVADAAPTFLRGLLTHVHPGMVLTVYFVLVLVQALITLVGENLFLRATVRWGVRLGTEFIQNILRSDFQHGQHIKPGEIETVIVRNIAFSIRIRHKTVRFMSDSILSFFYILIALVVSPHSLLLLVSVGVIALGANYATLRVRVRHSEIAKQKQLDVAREISEHFSDLRGLLMGEHTQFIARARKLIRDAFASLTRNAQISIAMRLLHQPVMFFIILSAVIFLKSIAAVPNAVVLVTLYVFYRAAPKLIAAVTEFSEVIEESPSDVRPDIERWERLVLAPRSTRPPTNMHIQFNGVDLGYNDAKPLLRDMQLEVYPGDLVCIIGKSGMGKSTILDTICGFHAPYGGEVLLGGVPYEELDRIAWRRCLGLLREEGVIVTGTWAENVAFLCNEINDARVEELLRLVGLADDVVASGGIQTQVAARGANLSAGQRQRLLLARALHRNPKLLILDEPTSNLDTKTEAEIFDLLLTLKGNLTIIVVSHRGRILQHADRVYEVTTDGTVQCIAAHVAARA